MRRNLVKVALAASFATVLLLGSGPATARAQVAVGLGGRGFNLFIGGGYPGYGYGYPGYGYGYPGFGYGYPGYGWYGRPYSYGYGYPGYAYGWPYGYSYSTFRSYGYPGYGYGWRGYGYPGYRFRRW